MSATHAIPRTEGIRTRSCPNCYLCNSVGEVLYESLSDRLFDAPGQWNLKKCPATECGMLWLDPMPIEEDIGMAYRSYSTHEIAIRPQENLPRRLYSRMQMAYVRTKYHYGQNDSAWDRLFAFLAYLNPIRRANCDFSVFYLEAKASGRLLDLGCGSGAMLKSMEALGWQVEGIDFDPVAVRRARERGLSVHLGTLADQKFPDNTFDAITASHFIEHIPDPLATLQECRRVLRPSGRLVFVTPNARSWGHRIYGMDWRGLEPPRHLGIFTPSAMASICRRAGLRPIRCRAMVRASGIVSESAMLRQSGKVDSARLSLLRGRPWVELRGLAQWAASIVDPNAGEEVLLIASK